MIKPFPRRGENLGNIFLSKPKLGINRRASIFRSRKKRVSATTSQTDLTRNPFEKSKETTTSWLNEIPRFEKPDESLHRQLVATRRSDKYLKEIENFKVEVKSILEMALKSRTQSKLEKLEMRSQFLKGQIFTSLYKPPEKKTPAITLDNLLLVEKSEITKSTRSLPINLHSINSLEFDPNIQVNSFLAALHEESHYFQNPPVYPERVDFPFVLVITGGPCSGKTTIAQFISKFFDVDVYDQFYEFEPIQKGIIITGQFELKDFKLIEKHLKRKISAIIVCTLAVDETYINLRLKNEVTGDIFHRDFLPPSLFDNPYEITQHPAPPTFHSSHYDLKMKKGQMFKIELCENYTTFVLKVEEILKQLYTQKKMDVPFDTFSNFRDPKLLQHSKNCFDAFEFWCLEIVPLFTNKLCLNYSRLEQKLELLTKFAEQKFCLLIFQKDEREIMRQKLEKSNLFFNRYWNLSDKIKKMNIELISDVLEHSGILKLPEYLSEHRIGFSTAVQMRFFFVNWFMTTFSPILNDTDFSPDLTLPQIPKFSLNDVDQIFAAVDQSNSFLVEDKKVFSILYQNLREQETKFLKSINDTCESLKAKFNHWVHLKYTFEMESFSRAFRLLKNGVVSKVEEFPIFHEELERLRPYLLQRGSKYTVDFESIQLVCQWMKTRPIQTIDDLYVVMNFADLEEKNKAIFEIQTLLTQTPLQINVNSLLHSLLPTEFDDS